MLLMSSLVQPKWTNSPRAASGVPAIFSLMKYSTAFTSWLVVFSMSFTRWASATVKPSAICASADASSAVSAGHSGRPGCAHSAASHAHSTATRRFTRPYSEKTSRSSSTFEP